MRTAGPRKSAFATGWGSGSTVSVGQADAVSIALDWSHNVRALFPDASEPVAEMDRGGAVVLRLRDSIASVARLTKPLRPMSAKRPVGAERVWSQAPAVSLSCLRWRKVTLAGPAALRRETATAAAFD